MVHFRLEEFRCRCCGGLPPLAKENIEALVKNVLDPARQRYGGPVLVNSGYRCPKHNAEVGGVPNSQHLVGQAADIRCGDNRRLAEILEQNGKYDQMIKYLNPDGGIRFVHVSWKCNGQNRRQRLISKK